MSNKLYNEIQIKSLLKNLRSQSPIYNVSKKKCMSCQDGFVIYYSTPKGIFCSGCYFNNAFKGLVSKGESHSGSHPDAVQAKEDAIAGSTPAKPTSNDCSIEGGCYSEQSGIMLCHKACLEGTCSQICSCNCHIQGSDENTSCSNISTPTPSHDFNPLDVPLLQVDDDIMFKMLTVLELKPECIICKQPLKKGNIGGIFPVKDVICKSLLCVSEYVFLHSDIPGLQSSAKVSGSDKSCFEACRSNQYPSQDNFIASIEDIPYSNCCNVRLHGKDILGFHGWDPYFTCPKCNQACEAKAGDAE